MRFTLREPSPNRGSDECRARGEVIPVDPNADIARLAQGGPPPPRSAVRGTGYQALCGRKLGRPLIDFRLAAQDPKIPPSPG